MAIEIKDHRLKSLAFVSPLSLQVQPAGEEEIPSGIPNCSSGRQGRRRFHPISLIVLLLQSVCSGYHFPENKTGHFIGNICRLKYEQ
jgi:hypothetical protein